MLSYAKQKLPTCHVPHYATLLAHGLTTWKTRGIPQFLQLDDDAVFNGGKKASRSFGQFVRLCLYLGIDLICLPVTEPELNGDKVSPMAITAFNETWHVNRRLAGKYVSATLTAHARRLDIWYRLRHNMTGDG